MMSIRNPGTVIEDSDGTWRVEWIDDDGGVEITKFNGPRSKERAEDHAALHYDWVENV